MPPWLFLKETHDPMVVRAIFKSVFSSPLDRLRSRETNSIKHLTAPSVIPRAKAVSIVVFEAVFRHVCLLLQEGTYYTGLSDDSIFIQGEDMCILKKECWHSSFLFM